MIEIVRRASLKDKNTFGIEAFADRFVTIRTKDQLQELIKNAHLQNGVLILGGGSNILFTKDYQGLVIQNRIDGYTVFKENDEHVWLSVGGGVNWHSLVLYTIQKGWQGLENLSLIPGTVGAAPIQNIGAYGVEQKDVFDHLYAIDLTNGQEVTLSHEQCSFGYRDSIFKGKAKHKYCITHVVYRLNKKHHFNITYGAISETIAAQNQEVNLKSISDAVIAIRSSKLPDPEKTGNAGSFFKNPVIDRDLHERLSIKYPQLPAYPQSDDRVKVPAGWLIEQSGWKGKSVGEAGVHDLQALVLVNRGNASGTEIFDLSTAVMNDVQQKFGIKLEREVNIL